MSANKKIKNATSIIYKGIPFKSKKEQEYFIKLEHAGFSPQYEVDKFILFNSFIPSKVFILNGIPQQTKLGKPLRIKEWSYTPDFKIEYKDYIIYIEVKGFPNDLWPYKRKLFLKLIDSMSNVLYYEVSTIDGLNKTINLIKNL